MPPVLLSLPPVHLVPLHLGALHAQERLLVLLVAFGPFLVLIAVVLVLRRRPDAAAREPAESAESFDRGNET
jgi:hypothetical protein